MDRILTVTVTKDCIDYLSAIVPILLSAIAIWISIHLDRQQNNIALFEKRYHAYELLQFIGDFCSNGISPYSRERVERFKDSENKEEIQEYQKTICAILSLWVCKRLIFDGQMSDEERTRHAVDCINGKTDYDLVHIMDTLLQKDRSELDRAALLFDYKTTKLIKETAETYQELCEQMLMCIQKNKTHAVDGFDIKLSQFVDVAENWVIGSKTMNKLQNEIRL